MNTPQNESIKHYHNNVNKQSTGLIQRQPVQRLRVSSMTDKQIHSRQNYTIDCYYTNVHSSTEAGMKEVEDSILSLLSINS